MLLLVYQVGLHVEGTDCLRENGSCRDAVQIFLLETFVSLRAAHESDLYFVVLPGGEGDAAHEDLCTRVKTLNPFAVHRRVMP